MNERNDRKALVGGGVSDRGATTISVPAQDFAGKAQAAGSRRTAKPRGRRRPYDHNGIAAGCLPLAFSNRLQSPDRSFSVSGRHHTHILNLGGVSVLV